MTDAIRSLVDNLIADFLAESLFAVLVLVLGFAWARSRGLLRSVGRGRATPAPDGYRVAYEDKGEIYVSGDGGVKNVTHHPAVDDTPRWSPSSRYIAFRSFRTGVWRLWIVNVENGKTWPVMDLLASRNFTWDTAGNMRVDLGGSVVVVKALEIDKRLGDA